MPQSSTATSTSASSLRSGIPIASHISGGVITSTGQVVGGSSAAAGSSQLSTASYVNTVASQRAQSQAPQQIQQSGVPIASHISGGVITSTGQVVPPQQVAGQNLLLTTHEKILATQKQPGVYLDPALANLLGVGQGNQLVPASAAINQTKFHPETFRNILMRQEELAKRTGQQVILHYNPQTGELGTVMGVFSPRTGLLHSLTGDPIGVKKLEGDVEVIESNNRKYAIVNVGGKKSYYEVEGAGKDIKDYRILRELPALPVSALGPLQSSMQPEERLTVQRQRPSRDIGYQRFEPAEPLITPYGAPNIPISRQKLQSRIDEDPVAYYGPENLFFSYDTLTGKLTAYAKNYERFKTITTETGQRGLVRETGQNVPVFEGSVDEFIKRYPQFADIRKDIYLQSGERTHKALKSYSNLPSAFRGVADFAQEATGNIERVSYLGYDISDSLLRTINPRAQPIHPKKYDIRIIPGTERKAASFEDLAYSAGYAIPGTVFTLASRNVAALPLGGKPLELVRTGAVAAGASLFGGTLIEAGKSYFEQRPFKTENIPREGYRFFIYYPLFTHVGSAFGRGGQMIAERVGLRPDTPIGLLGSRVVSGAASGAGVGSAFWATEGANRDKLPEYAATGAAVGGVIGLASGVHSLFSNPNLHMQQRDFIVRMRVGEPTTATESTARLPRPYSNVLAVKTPPQTVDIGYNLGPLGRFEYNPLAERVGFVRNRMFTGIDFSPRLRFVREPEVAAYMRNQNIPFQGLSKTGMEIYRDVAYERSLKARLPDNAGVLLRRQSPLMEIDKKMAMLARKLPVLEQRVASGNVVDMPERLTKAAGSKFTPEQAKAFVDAVKGNVQFFGRSTFPDMKKVKDIDVLVFGRMTKEGAQKYIIDKAKRLGLSVDTTGQKIKIQGATFDIHSSIDPENYAIGDPQTRLLGFGYEAPLYSVEAQKGTGIKIMHPGETLIRKATTTTYLLRSQLLAEQRRQKDVKQFEEMVYAGTKEPKQPSTQVPESAHSSILRNVRTSTDVSSLISSRPITIFHSSILRNVRTSTDVSSLISSRPITIFHSSILRNVRTSTDVGSLMSSRPITIFHSSILRSSRTSTDHSSLLSKTTYPSSSSSSRSLFSSVSQQSQRSSGSSSVSRSSVPSGSSSSSTSTSSTTTSYSPFSSRVSFSSGYSSLFRTSILSPPSSPPPYSPPSGPPTRGPPVFPPLVPIPSPGALFSRPALLISNLKKGYAPSLYAVVKNIYTEKDIDIGRFTPFELRPIVRRRRR